MGMKAEAYTNHRLEHVFINSSSCTEKFSLLIGQTHYNYE